MKAKLILLITCCICLSLNMSSVARGFYGHLGAALPNGKFGEDGEKWGGAAMGYNAGVQHLWDCKLKGVKLFLGADFFYNGLQDGTKDYWEGSFNFNKTHSFINVPVTGGVHYNLKIFKWLSLFGEAGAGPDFLKLTNDEKGEYARKFKISTGVGYKAGGGFVFKDKVYIGCHFYGLGNHDLKYSWDNEEGESEIDNVGVSLMTLTVGVPLWTSGKK